MSDDKVLPGTHTEGIAEPPYGTSIHRIVEATAGMIDTNFQTEPQRYGFSVSFEVMEPSEAAGQRWDHQWMAPDDDPKADGEGLARIMNGRNGFGKFCTKAGLDYRRQTASKICQLLKGKMVGSRTELRLSKPNAQGRTFMNTRLTDWFAKGEATCHVKEKPLAAEGPVKDDAPTTGSAAPPPPPPGTVGRPS